MTAIPRLVIAAPSSGHGKTAVTVGLLSALAGRGLTVAGYKIGPDHVDAAYLGLAGGRQGRNLDPRLVTGPRIGPLFAHGAQGADIAVIEGTMGLYDALSGQADVESTAQVAGMLRTPVVLIVDAGAMGQSVAALVHGFRSFDELLWLGGVVLTRVASDRHEEILRESLDDIGVPVLGALRRRDALTLPPRQMGMVPVVERTVEAVRAVRRLGEVVTRSLDLERVLAVARSAPTLGVDPWSPEDVVGDPVEGNPVVAVAGSSAFTFGYPETSELLAAAGAQVAPVDPLRDEELPEGTKALVIGGGFPEAYADELSANVPLCEAVAQLAHAGQPVAAESAGLLWLVKEFDGRPMSGVLDAAAHTTDQLVLGYRDAIARASSPVAKLGSRMMGHKSHRAVVSPRSGDNAAWQWKGGRPEGFVWRKVHASFLNLHWAGYPEIAKRFLGAIG